MPVDPAFAGEADPIRVALETKLQGQYRIIRLLGTGGMGSVYLARDLVLDREVAIKVVKAIGDSAELYDLFRREARIVARLTHPNIVPLHAFGEVAGMPYFVMGYVRGEALATRLRRDGRLSEEDARRVIAEIADALNHAHRQGVVHRDVKPDNVLLEDESGRALLTDFGIAKALGKAETVAAPGSIIGTPHYMSPEQASGHAIVDGRSDIYSLGIMAYRMLAGRHPFDGSEPADILTQHLTQAPPPLRSLAPALADSTVQAVERCLAKDPAQRWPDARSLKLALGKIEEAQLPDLLDDVQGSGIWLLTYATICPAVINIVMIASGVVPSPHGWWSPFTQLMLFVAWPVLFYIAHVLRLRRKGFPFAQSQRAIWREPVWWPFWYPRSLRRRGNVRDRLPVSVRRVRGWWAAGGIVVLSCLDLFAGAVKVWASTAGSAFGNGWGAFAVNVGPGLMFLIVYFVLMASAMRELRRMGLGSADSNRVLYVSLNRAHFWDRPQIADVLAPVPQIDGSRNADTPNDHLQAILRHADAMSGTLQPLGAQAAAAARQIIASIDEIDRQIARLAQNMDPDEADRLATKIESLTNADGSDDEQASMRVLLEKQLELVRQLSTRIEDATARRSRRVEMLKMLRLHLASLLVPSKEGPADVRSTSDRVQALCEEIEGRAEAKFAAKADGEH
ncbi:MAG: protein kinase [Proteobacteria bacterium]|nr:protein kinase [Pseudomonadota bacterium]